MTQKNIVIETSLLSVHSSPIFHTYSKSREEENKHGIFIKMCINCKLKTRFEANCQDTRN